MRIVVQRVTRASVTIADTVVSQIDAGLLVLLGVRTGDRAADADFLAEKCVHLRIFPDEAGKMNRSVKESGGSILLVSQFTLYGDCQKGRRPSFIAAAPPAEAVPLYERFRDRVAASGVAIACGQFGADMAVELMNDGPVTIIIDSPTRSLQG